MSKKLTTNLKKYSYVLKLHDGSILTGSDNEYYGPIGFMRHHAKEVYKLWKEDEVSDRDIYWESFLVIDNATGKLLKIRSED